VIGMRLSEILGMPVAHQDGHSLGVVHDVRLELSGEYGQREALQLSGLVAGPGGVATRLGYGSTEVTGPWMLRTLFRWLSRRTVYIPWSEVRLDGEQLVVTAPVDALRHPQTIEDDR
jgi:sporulation protein YlmC with PRC-barrel domain